MDVNWRDKAICHFHSSVEHVEYTVKLFYCVLIGKIEMDVERIMELNSVSLGLELNILIG